jgi:Outer membrane protein beta-barrel domain
MPERPLDRHCRRACAISALTAVAWMVAWPAGAQEPTRFFAGGLIGVSTLSADAEAVTIGSDAALSLYAPENGLAVNLFGGADLAQYFSVQANWMWNRNDLTLVSSFVTPPGGGFYEQRRRSHQHVVVLDALIYFRRRSSAIRPYLGTGLAILRFRSDAVASSAQGLVPPEDEIAWTGLGLRSHVGIDVKLSPRLRFRYSFSETISDNPISPVLTPPGPRRLANFENLFGLLFRF